MKSRSLFLVLLCVGSLAVQSMPAQTKRFDFDAAAKLVRLSDPQISPDGKSIIVVVSRANYKDNRWENELVLVETAGAAQRVLTFERHDVRHPRWSPSGDRLAFISSAVTGNESKQQIFVMSMSGGEAKRITSAPNGVQHFAWRPDGLEVAFATQDDSPNKSVGDPEIAFEVGNDHYLTTAAARPSHIWLTTAEGDKPTAAHFRRVESAGATSTTGACSAILVAGRKIHHFRQVPKASVWRC